MAKTVKVTKVEKLGMLQALVLSHPQVEEVIAGLVSEDVAFTSEDLANFVSHEIELLVNKSARAKKAKAVDELREAVFALVTDEPKSGATILAELGDSFPELSQAKVTSRLSALHRDGAIAKQALRVGKSTLQHYSLPTEVEEA